MAISSLERGSTAAGSPNHEQRQQLVQLVKAIHSGDLDGAQRAFGQLSLVHHSPDDPVTQALAPIGNALLLGSIDGAREALGALKQQAQAALGEHHPYGGPRGAGSYVGVQQTISGASDGGSYPSMKQGNATPATASATTGHTLDVTV
jgi:hypothetical protein